VRKNRNACVLAPKVLNTHEKLPVEDCKPTIFARTLSSYNLLANKGKELFKPSK